MPKIFYTERDIEDLYHAGVKSLVISDDVVVTDLGREKAQKLGFELVRENDQPSSAPIRPYITDKPSPAAAPPTPPRMEESLPRASLEDRVFQAVKSRVGEDVDEHLLKTIIHRVLRNIKGG